MNCVCGLPLYSISDGKLMCANCSEIRDSSGKVITVWVDKGYENGKGNYRPRGSWGWIPIGVLSVWNEIKI